MVLGVGGASAGGILYQCEQEWYGRESVLVFRGTMNFFEAFVYYYYKSFSIKSIALL